MAESAERDARHQARMQRKKALIDAKIAQAQDEYGLLLVHSGNGKGKSSSAFGMVARALGHGLKVGVVQFIKGAASTGEETFFRRFPEEVSYHVMGEGFTWDTQDNAKDTATARVAWEQALVYLRDPAIDQLVEGLIRSGSREELITHARALDRALLNVSYFYSRDVKESVGKAQSLIEPMLTLFMGALLGWIMLSVLGPVYDVISKIKT